MRSYLALILVVLGLHDLGAQTFEQKFKVPLGDTLTHDNVFWVDFDSDSLLDVVVKATYASNTAFLFFKSDTTNGPVYHSTLQTSFFNSGFFITDFDSDNLMDILITGLEIDSSKTSVLLNKSNFQFEQVDLLNESGSMVRFADLDADDSRELIISGSTAADVFTYFYRGSNTAWTRFDTLDIHASAIEVWDFNNDLFPDLFVSGVNKNAEPESWSFTTNGIYNFFDTLVANVNGQVAVSDFNGDGFLDVALTGRNASNHSEAMILHIAAGLEERIESLDARAVFAGDLDNDGLADLATLGNTAAFADTITLLLKQDDNYDTIVSKLVSTQHFGDYDRDGDLDIVQLTSGTDYPSLIVQRNLTEVKNYGPGSPSLVATAKIFDRLFIEWNPTADDHTDSESITYDVAIFNGEKALSTASFEFESTRRLLVAHGNVGTNKAVLMKTNATGEINFMIQAVDNAYYTGKNVCVGGGSGLSCTEVEVDTVFACKNEQVTLRAPHGIGTWFSFANGMLGKSATWQFFVAAEDTVFVVSPSAGGGCSQVDAFLIQFKDTVRVIEHPCKFVCADAELYFESSGSWEQVLWSNRQGVISSERTVSFTVAQNDTLKVFQSDGEGCILKEATPIEISRPPVEVEEETYQILRGEEVQLNAVGGLSYLWSPSEGLNNNGIGNPVASPWQTTEYIVTASDSIGCTATAKVLVIVEETAFIPNLFTPNDDGKNDALRAFGLDNVTKFKFTIFNREGALIYSTTSSSELAGRGWDGTSKGVKQPAGIYYWKVEGKNNAGGNLALNGKNMGSIVLIR